MAFIIMLVALETLVAAESGRAGQKRWHRDSSTLSASHPILQVSERGRTSAVRVMRSDQDLSHSAECADATVVGIGADAAWRRHPGFAVEPLGDDAA